MRTNAVPERSSAANGQSRTARADSQRPATNAINWNFDSCEIKRTKPLPGFCTINQRAWPVFWLAFILVCPCLPMHCTVAVEQIRQAYSSGGCAGLAREAISRVTGFPFHPPAEKQEGTIRVRRECTLIVGGEAMLGGYWRGLAGGDGACAPRTKVGVPVYERVRRFAKNR